MFIYEPCFRFIFWPSSPLHDERIGHIMEKQSRIKFPVLMLLLFVLQFMLFPANTLALTTNNNILPPSNLAFQLTTPKDVNLTWSSVYGATGYNIYEITVGRLKLLERQHLQPMLLITFRKVPTPMSYLLLVQTVNQGPVLPLILMLYILTWQHQQL